MSRALTRLSDGTVKQVNLFTGTEAWTVPGRGDRPLVATPETESKILEPGAAARLCAFCEERCVETPPEVTRLVREGECWHELPHLPAGELFNTTAEFRVVPNLFEIVSLDYWRENHGYDLPPEELARRRAYLDDPVGRAHVMGLVERYRPSLVGAEDDTIAASSILGGFHDVVIGRRHVVDGASTEDHLASSGTLTPDEHERYVDLTLASARRLYAANPDARNVVIFQNWLRPAGASFDHLHKQLVAIDELGTNRLNDIRHVASNPELVASYRNLLHDNGLIIAETDSAILAAGVGHRFPSLEVWTDRHSADLWNLHAEELRDLSALLQAAHVAMGPRLPANEEWHYRPPVMRERLPIRVVLKWRISNPAGFEGGSGVYINTIDPWGVADRTREWLAQNATRLSPHVRLVA